MRILITPDGRIEIQELSDKKYKTVNLFYPYIERSASTKTIKKEDKYYTFETKRCNSMLSKHKKKKEQYLLENFYKRNEVKVDPREISQSKLVTVKGPKLKDLFQKGFPNYENETEEGKNDKQYEKIKDLFKSKQELDETKKLKKFGLVKDTTEEDAKNVEELPIQSILPKDVMHKLEVDSINRNKSRFEDKKLLETEFRTTFQEKVQPLIKLNDTLKLKIRNDRANLITYLSQKKNISSICLENLKNSDEEKIMRANKICQILLHDKEINKNRKEVLSQKMIAAKNAFQVKAMKKVHSLGSYNLGITKEILKEYEGRKTIKEANKFYYKNKLREIYKKDWDNNFLNRQYEKLKKTQKVNSFLEDNESF